MSAKRLKGRYTATDDFSSVMVGVVRYLDPATGNCTVIPTVHIGPIAASAK